VTNAALFGILNYMDIAKVATIFAAVVLFFTAAPAAQAHLPYLEEGAAEVAVDKPEISKVYYGWLEGVPVIYKINSKKPFKLYLNLMSPQMSDARVDFSADIYRDGVYFDKINGIDFVWLAFYEPFANDYYIRGPEYEKNVPAGEYQIEIYNASNYGDYALAVGETEDLSVVEFFRTLAVLPQVKERFFGRDPWEAYNSFVGMIAFCLLAVILIILYLVIVSFRRRRMKDRLDNEDDEYKKNRKNRGENYFDLSEVQRLFGHK
jgi:cbb3-type cytochrome oxidase subunit 3